MPMFRSAPWVLGIILLCVGVQPTHGGWLWNKLKSCNCDKGGESAATGQDVNGQPAPKRHGCYSTHNDYGCGNFHSDMVFIFGSCRQFFGEPCYKTPPPLPGAEAVK